MTDWRWWFEPARPIGRYASLSSLIGAVAMLLSIPMWTDFSSETFIFYGALSAGIGAVVAKLIMERGK